MGGFAIGPTFIPGFGNIPPPPQQRMLIPHQLGKKVYAPQQVLSSAPAVVSAKPTIYRCKTSILCSFAKIFIVFVFFLAHQKTMSHAPQAPAPAPAPTPAATPAAPATSQSQVDFMALQSEVEKKLKKLKNEKVSAELAISQGI